jgi:F420-dependent oxidoreductase-like protein
MRFSYWPGAGQPWEEILRASQHAESTGWDGVWFADHFVPSLGDIGGPTHECWTVLAGLAAAVPRVRIGSIVAGNTYRNPAVLAKQAATVDHISGGRLVLGLGAAWQENEHLAYGIPFPGTKERLDRLDEACAVITSLFREERSSFSGRYYQLVDAPLAPKPVQERLPLLIGGGGERRTMRIAAQWADEWNVWGTPELHVEKAEVLARHCEDLGRDPSEIERSAIALLFLSTDEGWLAGLRDRDFGRPTIIGTPAEVAEIVGRYRAAGVAELLIPDFTMPDPARKRDVLDLFINEVAPSFR